MCEIISVDKSNIEKHGLFCVKNKKHPGYTAKRKWLEQRFKEGLRIKLILNEKGKQAGFIEYIPGEYTWRIVHAPQYFIIHCIWVNSKQFSKRGIASKLIDDCLCDANKSGMNGVATVTSDGTWMAGKDLFIKNGFVEVGRAEPHFQLMSKKIGKGTIPHFPSNLNERNTVKNGLQLLYTDQCPYIGKAIEELPPVAKEFGVDLKLVEIKDSKIAREKMLSPYGMINLIYNGKLLADHAISATRFKNILKKEISCS